MKREIARLIDTNRFLDLYIDLLTAELTQKDILDVLMQRWELERVYNTAKKMLVSSRKKKSRNALSRTNRRIIIKAIDQDHCQYCGSEVDYFEVDHVTPIDDLGTDALDNVATACHSCNRVKGDRLKEETRKEIERRRRDFLYKRAVVMFQTKKGRSILKRFLLDTPKE